MLLKCGTATLNPCLCCFHSKRGQSMLPVSNIWKSSSLCKEIYQTQSCKRHQNMKVLKMKNLMFMFLLFFCIFRFINARRRIVQPMIDQSNRAGEFSKCTYLNVVKLLYYITVFWEQFSSRIILFWLLLNWVYNQIFFCQIVTSAII